MLRKILPFVALIVLISCTTNTATWDYYGQTEPPTTPVIFSQDTISVKGRLEHGISFSPDRKELAFGILDKDDFSGVIHYSKRIYGKWTMPEVFEPLKNQSVFLPYFSPDGKSMLYAQSRADTNNGLTDLWILKKNHDNWDQHSKLDSPISSLTRESNACMTMDNTIYFSSNRDGNGLADLYFSSPENGEYQDVERIDAICSVRDEESIFVSPDEKYVIFCRYETNENGPDLFISFQDSQRNWTKPEPLDSTINTSNWERRPFITIDNKFLFFTRLTFDSSGIQESDIYWVNTHKVFKPYVFNPITEKTIKIGEETKLSIPKDYFMDIDDEEPEISLSHEKPDLVIFDAAKMTLTLNPDEIGEYDLIFTAIDKYSNKTEDSVKIIVEE